LGHFGPKHGPIPGTGKICVENQAYLRRKTFTLAEKSPLWHKKPKNLKKNTEQLFHFTWKTPNA
jgi:hypothetical protein